MASCRDAVLPALEDVRRPGRDALRPAWSGSTPWHRILRQRRRVDGLYRPVAVFVSDLRHFLDLPAETPAPARRMAEHLGGVVRTATAGDAGKPWVSALPCQRR